MKKLILRIIALLLVPCLLQEPVAACAANLTPHTEHLKNKNICDVTDMRPEVSIQAVVPSLDWVQAFMLERRDNARVFKQAEIQELEKPFHLSTSATLALVSVWVFGFMGFRTFSSPDPNLLWAFVVVGVAGAAKVLGQVAWQRRHRPLPVTRRLPHQPNKNLTQAKRAWINHADIGKPFVLWRAFGEDVLYVFWRQFLRRLPPNAVFLDMAAGNFELSLLAGERPHIERHALDAVPMARRNIPRGVHYYQAPMEETGLPSQSFDALGVSFGLDYTDLPRALSEARRILKPGGKVAYTVIRPESGRLALARAEVIECEALLASPIFTLAKNFQKRKTSENKTAFDQEAKRLHQHLEGPAFINAMERLYEAFRNHSSRAIDQAEEQVRLKHALMILQSEKLPLLPQNEADYRAVFAQHGLKIETIEPLIVDGIPKAWGIVAVREDDEDAIPASPQNPQRGTSSTGHAATQDGKPIDPAMEDLIRLVIQRDFQRDLQRRLIDELEELVPHGIVRRAGAQVYEMPGLAIFDHFLIAHPWSHGDAVDGAHRHLYLSPAQVAFVRSMPQAARDQFWEHEMYHLEHPLAVEDEVVRECPLTLVHDEAQGIAPAARIESELDLLEQHIKNATRLDDLPDEGSIQAFQEPMYAIRSASVAMRLLTKSTMLIIELRLKQQQLRNIHIPPPSPTAQQRVRQQADSLEALIRNSNALFDEIKPVIHDDTDPEEARKALADFPARLDAAISAYPPIASLVAAHQAESFDYQGRVQREPGKDRPVGPPHHVLMTHYLEALKTRKTSPEDMENAARILMDYTLFYYLSLHFMRFWDGGPRTVRVNRRRGEALLDLLQSDRGGHRMRFVRSSSTVFTFPMCQFAENEQHLMDRIQKILQLYEGEGNVNEYALRKAHDLARHLRPVIRSVQYAHREDPPDEQVYWLYEHRASRNSVDYPVIARIRKSLFQSLERLLKIENRSMEEEADLERIQSALVDMGDPDIELNRPLMEEITAEIDQLAFELSHHMTLDHDLRPVKFYPQDLPLAIRKAYFRFVDRYRKTLQDIIVGIVERIEVTGGIAYLPQGREDVLSSSLLTAMTLEAMLHPQDAGMFTYEDFDRISTLDLLHIYWISRVNEASEIMKDANTLPWSLMGALVSLGDAHHALEHPIADSGITAVFDRGVAKVGRPRAAADTRVTVPVNRAESPRKGDPQQLNLFDGEPTENQVVLESPAPPQGQQASRTGQWAYAAVGVVAMAQWLWRPLLETLMNHPGHIMSWLAFLASVCLVALPVYLAFVFPPGTLASTVQGKTFRPFSSYGLLLSRGPMAILAVEMEELFHRLTTSLVPAMTKNPWLWPLRLLDEVIAKTFALLAAPVVWSLFWIPIQERVEILRRIHFQPSGPALGILGTGSFGQKILDSLLNLPDMAVHVRAIVSDNRIQQINEKFGVSGQLHREHDTWEALLADPRIPSVMIVTPANTHFDRVKEALLAGKNVYVEKPFTPTSDQALELVRLAEENHCILMVGHLLLYAPHFQRLQKLVRDGDLGAIQRVEAQIHNLPRQVDDTSTALEDLGTHDLYMIRALLGEHPMEIRNVTQSEDKERARAEFDYNKIPVTVDVDRKSALPTAVRTVKVVGEKFTATFNHSPGGDFTLTIEPTPPVDDPSALDSLRKKASIPGKVETPLAVQLRAFMLAIRTEESPLASGRSAIGVVEMVEQLEGWVPPQNEVSGITDQRSEDPVSSGGTVTVRWDFDAPALPEDDVLSGSIALRDSDVHRLIDPLGLRLVGVPERNDADSSMIVFNDEDDYFVFSLELSDVRSSVNQRRVRLGVGNPQALHRKIANKEEKERRTRDFFAALETILRERGMSAYDVVPGDGNSKKFFSGLGFVDGPDGTMVKTLISPSPYPHVESYPDFERPVGGGDVTQVQMGLRAEELNRGGIVISPSDPGNVLKIRDMHIVLRVNTSAPESDETFGILQWLDEEGVQPGLTTRRPMRFFIADDDEGGPFTRDLPPGWVQWEDAETVIPANVRYLIQGHATIPVVVIRKSVLEAARRGDLYALAVVYHELFHAQDRVRFHPNNHRLRDRRAMYHAEFLFWLEVIREISPGSLNYWLPAGINPYCTVMRKAVLLAQPWLNLYGFIPNPVRQRISTLFDNYLTAVLVDDKLKDVPGHVEMYPKNQQGHIRRAA